MTQRKAWSHSTTSTTRRGYGGKHQRLRAQLLGAEPLCRLCRAKGKVKAATIADHIVSIAKGGAIHDLSNMQPVCEPCHNEKTLTEQGKTYRPKRRIGLDGWPIDE